MDYLLGPRLGPFYEGHGPEIIPLGYEESLERLAEALGVYAVRSNLHELDGISLEIDHYDLTYFIQEDWDRVCAGNSPRGFLLATRGGAYAAGRVAEEVILRRLLRPALIFGQTACDVAAFWKYEDRGLVVRAKGCRSDDLVVELADGRLGAVESKATFKGTRYLHRALTKVAVQLSATLHANPVLSFVLVGLIDISDHRLAIAGTERASFMADPDWLREVVEPLL